MRMPQLRRAVTLTLTAVAIATPSACFGSFHASRNLWKFNKDVSKNKWAQEAMFLGMSILPVYEIGSVLDVLIFNSVEFWTGENPLKLSSRMRVDDKRVVESTTTGKGTDRTMQIKEYDAGALAWTTTMRFVPGTDNMEFKTIFASGRVVSRVVAIDREGKAYLLSNHDSSP